MIYCFGNQNHVCTAEIEAPALLLPGNFLQKKLPGILLF